MSHDEGFRPAIEEIVSDWKGAIADGELCVHDYLKLAADSAHTIEEICDGIGGDDEKFNQLVSDCEWAVQTYIVPIDLGKYKVPKFLEQLFLDPQAVALVRPVLEKMRPKSHKTGPIG